MADKNEYFNEEEIEGFRKLLASIDKTYALRKELADLLEKDDHLGVRVKKELRTLYYQLGIVKDHVNDLYDAVVMDALVKEAKLAMNDPKKNFGDQPEFDD